MSADRGFGLGAGTAPEVVAAVSARAEELGYRSFWMNHPGAVDGIVELKTAADTTTRIDLGVGVAPLHSRAPVSIYDSVKGASLPIDRLILGLGSANPQALGRAREGVAELRERLDCRIALAALGPKMCRLAGEVADAVLFNWLTPAYARQSADWVREGAQAARRDPPRLYAYVRLALSSDARERVAQEASKYTSMPAYAAHFERMNVDMVTTAIAATTASDVAAQIEEWRDTVDEVVLRAMLVGSTLDEHLELLNAAAPVRDIR